ncbi:hypothetical protein [Nonomuraea sp. NPDC050783]|uniref:hypothetical protein n=1 Tax=Nonomuraea sp. NPDC050783 TaxID=3154634 RepID=UPI00346752FE
MTEFAGVRQPEFDMMAARHAEAARRLEELARALHGELCGAGLDTSPAVLLHALAGRVTAQADDLRRRQRLVRELQQQKITFGGSTPLGSFLELPDSLEAATGLLDGTLAGRAALKAADGDTQALATLRGYASRAGDAGFVRAFLGTLGARGVTRLPAALAARLRDSGARAGTALPARLAQQSRHVLLLLARALAAGTCPDNPAYLGDGFLRDLVEEGRADHVTGGLSCSGYQAQALVWRAHDGRPPYSAAFMATVGRDVIAYEHDRCAQAWSAGRDALGRLFAARPVPLMDLSAALGLGTLLRPGTEARAPGGTPAASLLDDLFHTAAADREAAQALLDHTPPGSKEPVLRHLLTTRWDPTRHPAEHEPFRRLLLSATTGQDPTSKKLAAELIAILAGEVRPAFGQAADGNLEIKDPDAFHRFAALRHPLGRAIAANIDELSRLLLDHATFGRVTATDMSYALALATSDDAAFHALVAAQTEHMRAALATVPPVGLTAANAESLGFAPADARAFDFDGDGRVGKADVKQFLTDRTVAEARPFSHLVEIRRQILIAQGLNAQKADESLKIMVSNALGLLPIPGAKQISTLATGAFTPLITKTYDHLTSTAYDQLAEHTARLMSEQGRELDKAHRTVADNRLAVERLAEQMLATAMLQKGLLDDLGQKKQSFTAGVPPKVKPFAQMAPQEYSQFLAWTRESGGSSDLLDRFTNTFRDTTEVDDYLGLQIPPSRGSDSR